MTTSIISGTEKELEAKVRDYLRSQGWLVFKFVSPGNRGVPDRIIIRDSRVVFLEFKTPKGRLSSLQKKIKKEIEEHGGEYYVIRNKSEAVQISENCDGAHQKK